MYFLDRITCRDLDRVLGANKSALPPPRRMTPLVHAVGELVSLGHIYEAPGQGAL